MASEPSIDAFLNGRFSVYQPTDGGHRSGLDALLVAAALPFNATGSLADFGAGSGVAGLAAMATCEGLRKVDLYEVQASSAHLARRTCNELLAPHMASKVTVIEGDVRGAKGAYRYVLCNPPFNDGGHRPSPNSSRAQAHAIELMGLADWIEIARKRLESNGQLAMIFRPQNLSTILTAMDAGFGAIRVLPIHPKADEPANRIVVTAIKGRRTPMVMLPGFRVHGEDGAFTRLANGIFNGEARLPI
ncbi:MAG: methyltransferase [Pseudomonadota bacterium]